MTTAGASPQTPNLNGEIRSETGLDVDLIPALIHSARPDGYLDYFNKPWLQYLGATLDDVTGWKWTAFIHPEDIDGIVAKWQSCLATGEVFEYETRVRSATGEYRWMFHRKVPLRDANGKIVKWYGSSLDIEERKAAEEKIREQETELRKLLNLIPHHVFVFGPDANPIYANQGAREYFGVDADQLVAESRINFVHPDDREHFLAERKKGLLTGAAHEFETRLLRHDGTFRWFLFRRKPLKDERGHILRWYGTATDIEDRKRAEEKIRMSEFYLAEGQRLGHMGSWAFDPDGFYYWSPELFRMHGLDPASKPPSVQEYLDRVHAQDRESMANLIKGILANASPFDATKRFVRPNGEVRYIRCVGVPLVETQSLKRYVGSAIDVTDHELLTQELRRREADLAEAQRLSQTGSWAWSPDGDIRYWSEECYRILSFDPQGRLPRFEEFVQRIHPNDQRGFRELLQTAIREKAEWEADYRIVRPGGAIRDVHVVGHPVLSTSGHLVEFVGTVIDVTERKRAEEERHRSEMELRQLLDFTPQLVSVFGPGRERLYANRNVLDYLGVGLDEWRQKSLGTHIHPDDSERVEACWDRALESGSGYDLELRLRKHDGSYRWFLARYNPVHDDKGQIMRWYAAGTDIDDRKRAEERLQHENVALREEIAEGSMFEEIVGTSPALRAVLSHISKVARTDSTVLITGETGTGKELVARAIHRRSKRNSRVFVSVNCSAIPRDLIASELFGHEKGAFTGATQQRVGRFELANGGTLFLDEVGELTPETQIALLRVLQEHEFERVGGTRRMHADVRVIAATNCDLQAAISAGSFRSDLYYRLQVFPIDIPPLRERKEDIRLLVEYFIDRYARKAGKNITRVDKKTLRLLESYPWPGNIRELQNVIERSVIVCEAPNFSVDERWLSQRPLDTGADAKFSDQVAAQEKAIIEAALRESQGRVSGQSGAAAKLGIARSTLDSKIQSLKINKNRFKPNSGT